MNLNYSQDKGSCEAISGILSLEDKKVIELLRFPLAILVLYIHVDLITGNTSPSVSPVLTPVLWNIDYLVSKILGSVSVPVFFLLSGLLFFKNGGIGIGIWMDKCKSRYRTLFIPYLAWNAIFLLVLAIVQCYIPNLMGNSRLIGRYSLGDFFLSFINMDYVVNGFSVRPFLIGPIDLPLWFIRDLMILVLMAPLLQCIIQRLGKYYIIAIVAFWLLGICKHFIFIGLNGICFFSVGAYLGIKERGFRDIKNMER